MGKAAKKDGDSSVQM